MIPEQQNRENREAAALTWTCENGQVVALHAGSTFTVSGAKNRRPVRMDLSAGMWTCEDCGAWSLAGDVAAAYVAGFVHHVTCGETLTDPTLAPLVDELRRITGADQADEHAERLATQIAKQEAQIANLEAALQTADARARDLNTSLDTRDAEIERLQRELHALVDVRFADRTRAELAGAEALIARLDTKPATPLAVTAALGAGVVAWLTRGDLPLLAAWTGWLAVAVGGLGIAALAAVVIPRLGRSGASYGPVAYARMTRAELADALRVAAADTEAATDVDALHASTRLVAAKARWNRLGMTAILVAAALATTAAILTVIN